MAEAARILSDVESTLTPGERNIVKYHRDTIQSGSVGRDKKGRPVTVYSTGIKLREGPFKGMFVAVPGYVNGRIVENDDELYKIWKDSINSGQWPLYKSGEELNKRSREIHTIMDRESPDG